MSNTAQEIIALKEQIRLREIADDGYFLSKQYKEDCRQLFELENKHKNQR